MALKSSMSLISGVPVSAISSGRAVRARMRSESCRTCWERCEFLFLMKCASSTTMPRKPMVPEPADVTVQHLVVDDHDVGEAVDRVAVAMDHGDRAVGCPQTGLAGPVGLDDVRYDDQQRVGVRGLRREQRLSGLAQARLVGEQEGPVPGLGSGDQLCLVSHQLRSATRRAGGRGLRQGHARRCSTGGALERGEQRAEQLPGRQASRAGLTSRGGHEVGGQEGIGELPRDDGLRNHPTFGRVGRGLRARG